MTGDILQGAAPKNTKTKPLEVEEKYEEIVLLMAEILHHLGCMKPYK